LFYYICAELIKNGFAGLAVKLAKGDGGILHSHFPAFSFIATGYKPVPENLIVLLPFTTAFNLNY
jgi:hypothetical protein